MERYLLFFAALLVFAPVLGYAQNQYTVSNTTDDDANTSELRGAIEAADALGGTTIITVDAGTYTLTKGSIQFGNQAENITIRGAGAGQTIILMTSGSAADRIFNVNPDAISGVSLTITGMTFQGGALSSDAIGGGAIQCGGPGNVTVIQNCSFVNDSIQNSKALVGVSNGGALAFEGGGSFSVSNCEFTNCATNKGAGGAIFFQEQGNTPASLTVTGSTFSGNTVLSSGAFGGAIYVSTAGNNPSSAVSITGNTFIGNVSGGGPGGAIDILNNTTSTFFVNYNRFYKNRAATAFSDVSVGGGSGNVDLTNNWWGENVAPVGVPGAHAGLTGATTGTLTANPYLELTCSGAATGLCSGSGGDATVVTASFARNSAGTTISSSLLGAFAGVPVVFSASQGTISSAATTFSSSGTATATFTDNGVAGTDNVQPVADSVTATDAIADGKITVSAPSTLAGGSTTTATFTVGAGGSVVTDGGCNELLSITPGGASPVSGSVTARVTIDASVQSASGVPYLQRHYDIEPAANAGTATATITLYFLQSEFNTYNASVSDPSQELPTGTADMTGRGNLTITQFHGTGTAPGNYTGWTGTGPASVLITPGASNVIWNSAKSWWEVSFSVTGFSGFYVTGPISVPLPVVLEGFGGVASGSGVLLSWKVGEETGLVRYEVQRSADGVTFTTIGSAGVGSRQFFDGLPVVGSDLYRLRMVNVDGSFTYSQVVVVSVSASAAAASSSSAPWVRVLGNPFPGAASVVITPGGSSGAGAALGASAGTVSLRLADAAGVVLWRSEVSLGVGATTLVLDRTATLAPGVYFLTVMGVQGRQTVELVKE